MNRFVDGLLQFTGAKHGHGLGDPLQQQLPGDPPRPPSPSPPIKHNIPLRAEEALQFFRKGDFERGRGGLVAFIGRPWVDDQRMVGAAEAAPNAISLLCLKRKGPAARDGLQPTRNILRLGRGLERDGC